MARIESSQTTCVYLSVCRVYLCPRTMFEICSRSGAVTMDSSVNCRHRIGGLGSWQQDNPNSRPKHIHNSQHTSKSIGSLKAQLLPAYNTPSTRNAFNYAHNRSPIHHKPPANPHALQVSSHALAPNNAPAPIQPLLPPRLRIPRSWPLYLH